jgi:thiol-disulfide isomerase/thioredoxin
MKSFKVSLKSVLLVGISFLFLSAVNAQNNRLPVPKIQTGIAKLTGKVINFHPKEGQENPTLTMYVPNPVTVEVGKYITQLSKDGSFQFEVPVESNTTLGTINSGLSDHSISVVLAANEETKLEIIYDEAGKITVNMGNRHELTSDDMMYVVDAMIKMERYQSPERIPRYNMLLEDFVPYELSNLEKKLEVAKGDSILTGSAKNYITNEYRLVFLNYGLFEYEENMLLDYRNNRLLKPNEGPDNFTPQAPNRSYYAFLKYFNLNDPLYLYNGTYPQVLRTILSNKTLNIPAIQDTPVNVWLKEVKTTMAGLIGFDSGLFYDMLAANAYALQLNEELKPLSDKQRENIRSYFKNEEFTKILLVKNEAVIKLEKEKNYFKTVVNKTPAVPKEAVMNAIISKYKGKAVLVDFWATWCGPCLDAMKETREVKNEMHGKDVVFVYITGVTSPQKLWEEKIKIIGGEHYYLTKEEWNYVTDSFSIKGIPSYLFYDKNGALKNKVTAYPGSAKMLKMIKELLP